MEIAEVREVAKADRMLAAAKKMEYIGGGFASTIGTAWIRADSGNKARLEAAFPELFERYAEGA